jgi:hypothetical protein
MVFDAELTEGGAFASYQQPEATSSDSLVKGPLLFSNASSGSNFYIKFDCRFAIYSYRIE